MKISIIVPLFHGYQYVDRIREMARRNLQGIQASAELIFVDDSPSDQKDIIVAQEPDLSCKVLRHSKNEGIHKSRVDGLNEAGGEYVLFLDQDDAISDDYLASQLTALGDGDWVLCNGIFRSKRLIYADQKAVENVLSESHYFTSLTEIVSPGQALLKREAIPESWRTNLLRHNYCDDAFLWMLLKDAGKKLRFNDTVAYFHNEDGANASFAWGSNAEALEELKAVIEQKKLLSEEHITLFRKAVEAEIAKQKTYAMLSEKCDIIERPPGKGTEAILYGFGFWGRKLYGLLHNKINIRYVVDKNIHGTIDGVVVHDLTELERMPREHTVYIAVPCEVDEIRNYLSGLGFTDMVAISDLFVES